MDRVVDVNYEVYVCASSFVIRTLAVCKKVRSTYSFLLPISFALLGFHTVATHFGIVFDLFILIIVFL